MAEPVKSQQQVAASKDNEPRNVGGERVAPAKPMEPVKEGDTRTESQRQAEDKKRAEEIKAGKDEVKTEQQKREQEARVLPDTKKNEEALKQDHVKYPGVTTEPVELGKKENVAHTLPVNQEGRQTEQVHRDKLTIERFQEPGTVEAKSASGDTANFGDAEKQVKYIDPAPPVGDNYRTIQRLETIENAPSQQVNTAERSAEENEKRLSTERKKIEAAADEQRKNIEEINEMRGDRLISEIPLTDPYWRRKQELGM